jgi:cytochrome c oxidase subunit 3
VLTRIRLSVDLCAIYWHFMLIVWLILFALFAGWANSFVDLCRQLIT